MISSKKQAAAAVPTVLLPPDKPATIQRKKKDSAVTQMMRPKTTDAATMPMLRTSARTDTMCNKGEGRSMAAIRPFLTLAGCPLSTHSCR
jgi:hypothetical protein